MNHPLHRKIGKSLEALEKPLEVVLDLACSSSPDQRIPLFMDEPKSRKNQICDVDALILEGDRIHTVIEVEESSFSPTQICGKILTSLFAQYYEHRKHAGRRILNNSKFIQILDDKSLKPNSKKQEQAEILKKKIADMLQNFSNITEYYLFWASDLDETCTQIINVIKK